MGGILAAIVSLIKAVPTIERLFLLIAQSLKESRANKKYDEELDQIDNAISAANGELQNNKIRRFEWSLDPDRSPPVSERSNERSGIHKSSTE